MLFRSSVSTHFHGVRIYGERATFINAVPDAVLFRAGEGPTEGTRSPMSIPYPVARKDSLIREFVAAIRGEPNCAVLGSEIFAALDVCFAIERSLTTGQRVPVA